MCVCARLLCYAMLEAATCSHSHISEFCMQLTKAYTHTHNVLRSAVIDRVYYIYAQHQFASHQRRSNEPLRLHTSSCPARPTLVLRAVLMMSMVMMVPVRPQPALQWTTMGTLGCLRASCSIWIIRRMG